MNAEDVLIILPVANAVLFPGVVLPIAVTGDAALAAAQEAVRTQRRVGLVLQTDTTAAAPGPACPSRPARLPARPAAVGDPVLDAGGRITRRPAPTDQGAESHGRRHVPGVGQTVDMAR